MREFIFLIQTYPVSGNTSAHGGQFASFKSHLEYSALNIWGFGEERGLGEETFLLSTLMAAHEKSECSCAGNVIHYPYTKFFHHRVIISEKNLNLTDK